MVCLFHFYGICNRNQLTLACCFGKKTQVFKGGVFSIYSQYICTSKKNELLDLVKKKQKN
jgi:hypothetical protein